MKISKRIVYKSIKKFFKFLFIFFAGLFTICNAWSFYAGVKYTERKYKARNKAISTKTREITPY